MSESLSFYTSKQLFDELASRFGCFIYCGYIDRDKHRYALTIETKGNAPEVVGLASIMYDHTKNLVLSATGDVC